MVTSKIPKVRFFRRRVQKLRKSTHGYKINSLIETKILVSFDTNPVSTPKQKSSFYPRPSERSVGLQMDFFFFSPPPLLLHTTKFLFLLGTENAVGGGREQAMQSCLSKLVEPGARTLSAGLWDLCPYHLCHRWHSEIMLKLEPNEESRTKH